MRNHDTNTAAPAAPPRAGYSLGAQVAVGILRTGAVLERMYNQIVMGHGITIQQYDVLQILRAAGDDGLPTLMIRDRMIHEAPGITRLIDRLETAGLVRRERSSPDRRQVLCHLAPAGRRLLDALEDAVTQGDDAAVSMLTKAEQRELLRLLGAVRQGR